jgi:predicted metalloprotease with PDZ domain
MNPRNLMHTTSRRNTLVLLIAATGSAASAQDQPKPSIGFGVKVFTEGLFGTTVSKVLVTQVAPDSQAQSAGLAVGDELIRVQGVQVPGGNALALKPLMEFVPGEPKKLVFKRPSGAEYEATLTKAKP